MAHAIRVVKADDWLALYVDGTLVVQNHSIDWTYELSGYIDIKSSWAQTLADELGGFPADLSDVVLDEGEVWS